MTKIEDVAHTREQEPKAKATTDYTDHTDEIKATDKSNRGLRPSGAGACPSTIDEYILN